MRRRMTNDERGEGEAREMQSAFSFSFQLSDFELPSSFVILASSFSPLPLPVSPAATVHLPGVPPAFPAGRGTCGGSVARQASRRRRPARADRPPAATASRRGRSGRSRPTLRPVQTASSGSTASATMPAASQQIANRLADRRSAASSSRASSHRAAAVSRSSAPKAASSARRSANSGLSAGSFMGKPGRPCPNRSKSAAVRSKAAASIHPGPGAAACLPASGRRAPAARRWRRPCRRPTRPPAPSRDSGPRTSARRATPGRGPWWRGAGGRSSAATGRCAGAIPLALKKLVVGGSRGHGSERSPANELTSEQPSEEEAHQRGDAEAGGGVAFHRLQRAVEHVADAGPADGLQPLGGLLAEVIVERLGLLQFGLGPRRASAAEQAAAGSSGDAGVVVSSLMAGSLRILVGGSPRRRRMQNRAGRSEAVGNQRRRRRPPPTRYYLTIAVQGRSDGSPSPTLRKPHSRHVHHDCVRSNGRVGKLVLRLRSGGREAAPARQGGGGGGGGGTPAAGAVAGGAGAAGAGGAVGRGRRRRLGRSPDAPCPSADRSPADSTASAWAYRTSQPK